MEQNTVNPNMDVVSRIQGNQWFVFVLRYFLGKVLKSVGESMNKMNNDGLIWRLSCFKYIKPTPEYFISSSSQPEISSSAGQKCNWSAADKWVGTLVAIQLKRSLQTNK